MTEPDMMEDQAARYVLGELGEKQRREFELRLEKSAELRALVHALEAGATALSLASLQREPPPGVWRRIEETVAREENRKRASSLFGLGWLRNGWAAAAACLLGWVFYALWVNMDVTPTRVVSMEDSHVEGPATNLAVNATAPEPRGPAIATNTAPPEPKMSLAAMGQIAGLRQQVRDMEAQLAQLSQAVTEQQALLAEPDRLKFFHLLPTEFDGITGTNMPPPSPALQRALLLAVARELGWLPETGTASGEDLGVNFVDLPLTGTNQTVTTQSAMSETQQGLAQTSEPAPDTFSSSPSGVIPGYVLADADGNPRVVFALDSTVLPGETPLEFWVAPTAASSFQFFGSPSIGSDPSVFIVNGANSVAISNGESLLYYYPISTNAP